MTHFYLAIQLLPFYKIMSYAFFFLPLIRKISAFVFKNIFLYVLYIYQDGKQSRRILTEFIVDK
jgi:hypothetical protein